MVRNGKQQNICVFIGNGFDIRVLNSLKKEFTTSYAYFHGWLKSRYFDPTNMIFEYMTIQKKAGNKLWSDFESIVADIFRNNAEKLSEKDFQNDFKKDFEAIQNQFTAFLNEKITNDILVDIGERSSERGLAKSTLMDFSGDIFRSNLDKKFLFSSETGHYDTFNWNFINFNYTFLFDSYIYLDKLHYEPHPYKTSDNNFKFRPNPNNDRRYNSNKDTIFQIEYYGNIFHPHGVQTIPKSILFGLDTETELISQNASARRFIKQFIKPYWAEYDNRYKPLIESSQLFIVFGLSFGETDKWWWESIIRRMLDDSTVEVVIYTYSRSKLKTTETFLSFSEGVCNEEKRNELIKRIFIVPFNDDNELEFSFKIE